VLLWSTLLTSLAGMIGAPLLIMAVGGGLDKNPKAYAAPS
jgi:peptidoglycan biosynthesis protein MviN/MurJ (putative lipid II flippase)